MSSKRPLKVAAAQITPVFMKKRETVEKYAETMLEAGRQGVELLVTPETGIPTYPYWRNNFGYTSPESAALWKETVVDFYEQPSTYRVPRPIFYVVRLPRPGWWRSSGSMSETIGRDRPLCTTRCCHWARRTDPGKTPQAHAHPSRAVFLGARRRLRPPGVRHVLRSTRWTDLLRESHDFVEGGHGDKRGRGARGGLARLVELRGGGEFRTRYDRFQETAPHIGSGLRHSRVRVRDVEVEVDG